MIRFRRFLFAGGILGVLIPLFAIWYPELRHYHVTAPAIPREAIRASLAELDARACSRFADHDLSAVADASAEDIDRAIAALNNNVLVLPGGRPLPFHSSFAPSDLTAGGGPEQLLSASLGVPDALLRAWQRTSDINYLRRAREYVRGW